MHTDMKQKIKTYIICHLPLPNPNPDIINTFLFDLFGHSHPVRFRSYQCSSPGLPCRPKMYNVKKQKHIYICIYDGCLLLALGSTFSFGIGQKDWGTLLQSEHLNSAQLALSTEFKIEISKSESLLENVTKIP